MHFECKYQRPIFYLSKDWPMWRIRQLYLLYSNQSYQVKAKILPTFMQQKPKASFLPFWILFLNRIGSKKPSLWLFFYPNCLIGSKCTNSSQRPICGWPLILSHSASLMHQTMTSDTMSLNFKEKAPI